MIKHILKNGKVLKDITGHKVKRKDNPRVYDLLERGENYGRIIEGNLQAECFATAKEK